MSNVKPIPDGYASVTPYLMMADSVKAIEFYKQAFGAKEIMRFVNDKNRISHAEIQIGNSIIMLADAVPEMNCHSPEHFGGSPMSLMLYVENVDKTFEQAIATGAKAIRQVQDQFYGDRLGTLSDPFGYTWTIATHIEDLTMEEVRKRAQAMAKA